MHPVLPVQRDLGGEPQDVCSHTWDIRCLLKKHRRETLDATSDATPSSWIFSPWFCTIETRMKIMRLCL